MITFQINSTDISAINQLLDIARKQLNLSVKVLDDLKKPQLKDTKWSKFAQEMDGLFTPEMVEHFKESRKEARDGFIARISE